VSAIVEGKVAALEIGKAATDTAIADHETRLRELERRLWRIEIALAVLVAEIPIAIAIATLILRASRP
jgi:hypothetical protein